MTILYTKQGEKLRQWQCFAEGADVVVIHGQVSGKQVEKRYTLCMSATKPSNIKL